MSSATYLITTKRLGLRPYRESDEALLSGVFSDSYTARFYPGLAQPGRVRQWIADSLENHRRYGFALWAAELLETSRLVGDAGLMYRHVDGGERLKLGYHMHESVRGRGLAYEAASACLDFAFEGLPTESVCSIVHPNNIASASVARRLHSSKRLCERPDGPAMLFFTTKDQWQARQGQPDVTQISDRADA